MVQKVDKKGLLVMPRTTETEQKRVFGSVSVQNRGFVLGFKTDPSILPSAKN